MDSTIQWPEQVAFAIAAGLAVFVLAETGLRAWGWINPGFADSLRYFDILSIQIEPMGRDGFRQRPNAAFHYPGGAVIRANALGFRGPIVAIPKPSGTLRVALVGGSATYGWGVNDNETIDTYLRRRLANRYPGSRVEVVNLAFDGYDSYQISERVRVDGVRLQPDVIIVNAGINDVRNARFPDLRNDPDPRTILWLWMIDGLRKQQERGRATLKTWLKHRFYVARFASHVWDSLTRPPVSVQSEPTPETHPNLAALDYYERNLRRTAAIASENGAGLLLSPEPSGIPGNLPPDATSRRDYWITNAAVTQDLRDKFSARTRAVAAALREEGHRVALVPHTLMPDLFIDEAHLKPAGNEAMAADFETAVVALLGAASS